ncbi:hypothetical protein HBB16_10745 [Pseudonocardia sp. MCCB 268]|nr:hypothetical protein [Pseudonocardia cytotoxica]
MRCSDAGTTSRCRGRRERTMMAWMARFAVASQADGPPGQPGSTRRAGQPAPLQHLRGRSMSTSASGRTAGSTWRARPPRWNGPACRVPRHHRDPQHVADRVRPAGRRTADRATWVVLYTDDRSMDPVHVTRTVQRGGGRPRRDVREDRGEAVTFDDGARVSGMRTAGGRLVTADRFVIAAGAASGRRTLFRTRLDVEAGHGWSLVLPTDTRLAGHALMSIEDHIVSEPGDASIRITGGMQFGRAREPGAGRRTGGTSVPRPRGSSPASSPSGTPAPSGPVRVRCRPRAAIVRRVHDNVVAVTSHGTRDDARPHSAGVAARMLCG